MVVPMTLPGLRVAVGGGTDVPLGTASESVCPLRQTVRCEGAMSQVAWSEIDSTIVTRKDEVKPPLRMRPGLARARGWGPGSLDTESAG